MMESLIMTLQLAEEIVGGLTRTSKMPWYSWSISALDCITGSKLRKVKGSVCSKCYACKGCYVFPVVKEAHKTRLQCLDDPRYVDAMMFLLNSKYYNSRSTYTKDKKTVPENRFRWFDSGDLQSVDHLRKIVAIAEGVPFVDFWLPTKEATMVSKYLKSGGVIPKNLTIRISNPMIGETFKSRPMGLPFSTVGVKDAKDNCPAYQQGGKCLDCRKCWDKDVDTNYPLH